MKRSFTQKTRLAGYRWQEKGVTSLIIVIFSALLMSVLTVSFITIMVREAGRAADDEMSQSAYDSAMAGVEDAKRVILACRNAGGIGAACSAIDDQKCNTVAAAGIAGNVSDTETLIQSTTGPDGGAVLNQAYTCVKIQMNTPDYTLTNAEMSPGRSQVVALRGASNFNRIKIEWQLRSDNNGADPSLSPVGRCSVATNLSDAFCKSGEWGSYPAVMRLQAITPTANFNLSDLDKKDSTATVFLYPSTVSAAVDTKEFTRYAESNGEGGGITNWPFRARCISEFVSSYGCSAEIDLPREVEAGSRVSLLRLTALYRSASVRLSLYNGTTPVDFDGVQPAVDSTGRAGDIFRRVYARLSMTDQHTYPEYAVDLREGSLCKNFFVTNNPAEASEVNGTSCTP